MSKTITIFLALFLIFTVSVSFANECGGSKLSDSAREMIVSYLSAVIEFRNADSTKKEEYRYKHNNIYVELDKVLNDKTPNGDQAIAYLLHTYTGSHPSEELECSAINRGKNILPYIKLYSECLPSIGMEPLPMHLKGSGSSTRWVITSIEKGELCTNLEQ